MYGCLNDLSTLFPLRCHAQEDGDGEEWVQLLRPSEFREVLELERARKGVERQIIHNNQVTVHAHINCC